MRRIHAQMHGLPSASVQGGDGCQQLLGLEAETPPLFAHQEHGSGPPTPPGAATVSLTCFQLLLIPPAPHFTCHPELCQARQNHGSRTPGHLPEPVGRLGWLRLASHSLWGAGRGLPLHPPLHPQEHEPLPASVIKAASPSVILAEVSHPLGVDAHAPDFLMWADPR